MASSVEEGSGGGVRAPGLGFLPQGRQLLQVLLQGLADRLFARLDDGENGLPGEPLEDEQEDEEGDDGPDDETGIRLNQQLAHLTSCANSSGGPTGCRWPARRRWRLQSAPPR